MHYHFRHHSIKKWPAPNYKGKYIKRSEGGGNRSGRYLLNISVKIGNIHNVNLTAIKTSVSLSECRVQREGLLAKAGIWAGINTIRSNTIKSYHQSEMTLKLEALRTFPDFYSARPSLRALHQFGSTVKISDLQEIAHSSENF